jgi:chlorobactene glucosyltransferase
MAILASLALAVWAFALINVILNLALLGRAPRVRLEREPFVSIVVPARNEERSIERSVRKLLAQDYGAFEVIVVNDRSTDSTGAILDRIATDDTRLKPVHGEETPDGWLGKPWALHEGSDHARGELILFVDADVDYRPDALRTAVEYLEATKSDLVALLPQFEMHGLWENALMPAVPLTPFSNPVWLGNYVPHRWFGVGAGTGNLIRRSAYDTIGGHRAMRDAVIDDVGLGQHVRRCGLRTRIARTEHLVSVRMYHGFGEIVRGFTKNMFVVIGRSYVAAALVLVLFFITHLLPIALAAFGNRIALAAVALLIATRVVFFTSQRYPLWSAVLLDPLMTIGWMWITIRSAWITGVRGELDWRGRKYDPARTRFGAGEILADAGREKEKLNER